jgi:beta-lactamase superfamily II metal-dependent hydrolase
VLERLAARAIHLYRTDRQGTITFASDGQRVRIDRSHHD